MQHLIRESPDRFDLERSLVEIEGSVTVGEEAVGVVKKHAPSTTSAKLDGLIKPADDTKSVSSLTIPVVHIALQKS